MLHTWDLAHMLHTYKFDIYIYTADSGTACTRTPGHTVGAFARLQAESLCSLLRGCNRETPFLEVHRPAAHVLGRSRAPATEVLGVRALEPCVVGLAKRVVVLTW